MLRVTLRVVNSVITHTPPNTSILTAEQRTDLAAPITKADLEYSLAHMKKGVSPGVDRLTVEFYRRFWPIVGDLVIQSLDEVQEWKAFSRSQRKGILKLLPKPRKDPRFVKCLRPITLLNVDYKLFTKVLADRTKVVLPTIVHTDQNGFIKNRFLGNSVLDVYSLMALADQMGNNDMVLLSLDIEKAFDSVRWDFLRTVLWSFGFPDEYLSWIELTHQNAFVQIANNGHLSHDVKIGQGLAQGCGLSPFLFIIAIEGLANTIRQDPQIPGIAVGQHSKKISLVADDSLLSFIGSPTVIQRVKLVLDHFSHVSGLRLNYDKSILVGLGPRMPDWITHPCMQQLQKVHISEGFTYLGIFASSSRKKLDQNFPLEVNLISRAMHQQIHRHTSLTGRILQMKQLVISRLVYRFQLLPTPSLAFMTKTDEEIHNYIWEDDRHRIRKSVMCQPTCEGRFGMTNLAVVNMSLKFAWFNRLLADAANVQFWSDYLVTSFVIPLNDALNCNLHCSGFKVLLKPKVLLPHFWHDVLF